MFPSEPGTFNFVNRITTWMKRQRKRLWVMIPFWDSVGMAMINECTAEDMRIICRPGELQKYLRKDLTPYPLSTKWRGEGAGGWGEVNKDLHTKLIVGDSASLMGSFNMTYQSMFDNLEQATFSRSNQYPEHFLSEWERLSQLEEG
jgi:phosphatidylserine/phosphatidylglycerophosphate/cardiolipin synthase-like enzyme